MLSNIDGEDMVFSLSDSNRAGNLTMFSFNAETKEIKVVPIKRDVIYDYRTRTPINKQSIVIEKNCIYHQALNKKNFIKILKRYRYV